MRKDLNKKDPYGRLLKKEKIPVDNEHFVLQEYRWLDFSTDRLIFTDNTRASVIQKDLHDPKELRSKVTVPKAFTTSFRAPTQPLFPIDLSSDYRKFVIETRQRRKRRNFDDDDSTTIDFSEISTPPDLEGRMSKWKARTRSEEQSKEGPPAKGNDGRASGSSSVVEPAKTPPEQFASAADSAQRSSNSSGAAFIPSAPSDMEPARKKETDAAEASFSASEVRRGMRPASDISQAARDRILASLNARTSVSDEAKNSPSEELLTETDSAFLARLSGLETPESAEGFFSDLEANEDTASDTAVARGNMDGHSNPRLAQDETNPKQTPDERLLKESYDEGYQAATEKFKELHNVLDATSKEVQRLREKVMLEGREIFMEVLKLSTENILRQQLALNDAALKNLFESAVENLHQARKIAVSCSAKTLGSLKAQYQEASLPFDSVEWIVNESLPDGDIKIVTKDEVIKVDLAQLVKKQIASFAEDLFGEGDGSPSRPEEEAKGEAS